MTDLTIESLELKNWLNRKNIRTSEIRRIFNHPEFNPIIMELYSGGGLLSRTKSMVTNILKGENENNNFIPFKKNESLEKKLKRHTKKITKSPKILLRSESFQYYKNEFGAEKFLSLLKELIKNDEYSFSDKLDLVSKDYLLSDIVDFSDVTVPDVVRYLNKEVSDMTTLYFTAKNLQFIINKSPDLFYDAFNSPQFQKESLLKKSASYKNIYNFRMTILECLLNFLVLDFERVKSKVFSIFRLKFQSEPSLFVNHEWSEEIEKALLSGEIKSTNKIIIINAKNNKYSKDRLELFKQNSLYPFPLNKEEQSDYLFSEYFFDGLEILTDLNSSISVDSYTFNYRLFNEIWEILPLISRIKIMKKESDPYNYFFDNKDMIYNIFNEDLTLNETFSFMEDIKEMKTAI